MKTKDERSSESSFEDLEIIDKRKKRTMCERLNGLKALIVGADSRIGRDVSLAYANEGCDLAINYQPENIETISKWSKGIDDTGCRSIFVPNKLNNENECKNMVESVIGSFERIDVLVFATHPPPNACNIEDLTTEKFRFLLENNILSLFWTLRAVQPYMKLGSSIIVTSSYRAYQPDEKFSIYAASEAATISFSRSMAKQFWTQGVRVNVVVPIPVLKKKCCVSNFKSLQEDKKKTTDICQVYISLASKESRYVTDEIYNVVCNMPY